MPHIEHLPLLCTGLCARRAPSRGFQTDGEEIHALPSHLGDSKG